jgi:hypothetical protein
MQSENNNQIIFHTKKNKIIDRQISLKFNFFLFSYNNKSYIISIHHFLSFDLNNITTIYDKKKYKNICLIKPIWNEIIILNSIPEIEGKSFVFKHYRLTKPLEDEELYTEYGKIKLKFIDYELINIGWINKYPRLLYYKMTSDIKISAGYSGSPIFDSQNKLVGIICTIKYDYILVLPIIYLIKTLQKKDNNNIYWINENMNNILKINNYNFKSNNLYYKALGNIPIDIYFLLEGDNCKSLLIKFKDKNNKFINFENITNKFPIKLHDYNEEETTLSMLKLMKILGKGTDANKIIKQLLKN